MAVRLVCCGSDGGFGGQKGPSGRRQGRRCTASNPLTASQPQRQQVASATDIVRPHGPRSGQPGRPATGRSTRGRDRLRRAGAVRTRRGRAAPGEPRGRDQGRGPSGRAGPAAGGLGEGPDLRLRARLAHGPARLRPADHHQLPVVLRQAPAQGDLADPPAPGCLRRRRRVLVGLRPRRHLARDPAAARRVGQPGARGVHQHLHHLAGGDRPAGPLQRPDQHPALPPGAAARRAARGLRSATTSSARPGSRTTSDPS